jgi:hypothetical protein
MILNSVVGAHRMCEQFGREGVAAGLLPAFKF